MKKTNKLQASHLYLPHSGPTFAIPPALYGPLIRQGTDSAGVRAMGDSNGNCRFEFSANAPFASVQVTHSSGLLHPVNSTLAASLLGRDVVVIADACAESGSLGELRAYLRHYDIYHTVLRLPARPCNEHNRSIEMLERALPETIDFLATPRSCLLAVGGCALASLAGYLASQINEGRPWFYLPLTPVGLLESTVAHHAILNAGFRKDALKTLNSPRYIYWDRDFFTSLSDRSIAAGFLAMLRASLRFCPEVFAILETLDRAGLTELFRSGDSHTILSRLLIALGKQLSDASTSRLGSNTPTLGHAISPLLETSSRFACPYHVAVAVDIAVASHLSESQGKLSSSNLDRVLTLCKQITPVSVCAELDPTSLWDTAFANKEFYNREFDFPVPMSIGTEGYLSSFTYNSWCTAILAVSQLFSK